MFKWICSNDVASNLLLRLHSWKKKCFCLFSVMFQIEQEDIYHSFSIPLFSLPFEVFEMCNVYITYVHYFEIHFSLQESVFSRWMYQVFWCQCPQRCTWHALLGIRALAWNSFLYIPSFHIIPASSRSLSLGTNGERAVKVSLCCKISQFLWHGCCWMSSEPNLVSVTEDKMFNSSYIKKQGTLNLSSRLHMHISHPQHTGVSHIIRMGFFIQLFASSSRTRPIIWGRAAHSLTIVKRKSKRTNQCACLGGGFCVLLLSLGTTRQDQNTTSVCFLGTCSTWSCQTTSFTAFLKTLSARQTMGQGEKDNLICHVGLHFWSWEESESSSMGSLADLPTHLRHWPWHSWHSKKHHSWCLSEPQVHTTQFVTSLIYFSVQLKWKMLNCEEHCSHSDDEQHRCTWAYIFIRELLLYMFVISRLTPAGYKLF